MISMLVNINIALSKNDHFISFPLVMPALAFGKCIAGEYNAVPAVLDKLTNILMIAGFWMLEDIFPIKITKALQRLFGR